MHIKVLSVNLGYCYSESIIYIGLIIKRLAIHDDDFWWHCGNHDESVNESLFRKLVSYFSIRRNGGLLYNHVTISRDYHTPSEIWQLSLLTAKHLTGQLLFCFKMQHIDLQSQISWLCWCKISFQNWPFYFVVTL